MPGAVARLNSRQTVAAAALVAAPLAMLVGFVLLPALSAIIETLIAPDGAFPSLARYGAFLADALSRANLWFSLVLTTASTATAIAISLLIALYLRFGTGRLPAVVQALALFPLFVPGIIVAFALMRFLGTNGLFQILIEQVGITGYRTPYLTPVGPFLAFVWESLPLPVLILTAGLAAVSDEAVAAARDLGAGALRILVEILLPQVLRPLLIAFSLTFLGIFGSYTIPYLLGPAAPEMMGVFMQRTYGQLLDHDTAQVQAVISFLVCALVSLFYLRSMARDGR